jgi:hypothetical protein
MFLALAGTACAPFDCIDGGAGISYMRSSPDTACKTEFTDMENSAKDAKELAGGKLSDVYYPYTTRLVCGAIALSCCIAAIVLIAITLRGGRAKLFSDERFMRTFGSLYLRYDQGAYYWEVLVLLRKLLLVLIARVLSSDQAAQIACSAAVLSGALLLQLLCKPFLSDALDRLERDTLAACLVIVALGAASNAGADAVAVMVAFYAILLAAAGVVGNDLLLVWREGNDDDDAAAADDDAAADGSTAKLPIVGDHAGTKILV